MYSERSFSANGVEAHRKREDTKGGKRRYPLSSLSPSLALFFFVFRLPPFFCLIRRSMKGSTNLGDEVLFKLNDRRCLMGVFILQTYHWSESEKWEVRKFMDIVHANSVDLFSKERKSGLFVC